MSMDARMMTVRQVAVWAHEKRKRVVDQQKDHLFPCPRCNANLKRVTQVQYRHRLARAVLKLKGYIDQL